MAHGIETLEVKQVRGGMMLLALGRTNRGKRFIVESHTLDCPRIASANFKDNLAKAVNGVMSKRAAKD